MTARDFCYWLQGYFEINAANPPVDGSRGLTGPQTDAVKRHLSLVFAHDIDPKAGGPAVQKVLDDIHGFSGMTHPNPNIQVRC